MKQFACGGVVPGCDATFNAQTEDELLGQIATHAKEVHGMEEVPPDVLASVRAKIEDVPA